jgi:Fe-S cluster biogenesis protein NfuA
LREGKEDPKMMMHEDHDFQSKDFPNKDLRSKDLQPKDFQANIQRIGQLVADLENISDPEARACSKALVQLLLDLHAAGLERSLEIIAQGGDAGQRAIDDLGRDPLVSSLLVLYDLHPLDLEGRVIQAVEKIAPRVRKGGGELELLDVKANVVRVHVQLTGHTCGSTGKTLKAMVEDAMYEAAPDMGALVIEGLEDNAGASGFVPIGKLGSAITASSAIVESR